MRNCPQAVDGCEFIDDGDYGQPTIVKMPWPYQSDCIELAVSTLLRLADQTYLTEISLKDKELIENLIKDIKINGLQNPLTLVYDKSLKIRLQDGNHRLLAIAQISGWSTIPVELRQVPRVRAAGTSLLQELPLSDLLELL